jgi:hypothetical protein
MDDFRVGSVPSSEPYGDRHPYGSLARKRQKHHGENGQQDDTADSFEASSEGEDSSTAAADLVEDYYLPSATVVEEE